MDGGYYAIKGFEYQIDKNILEILSEKDENKRINIEQVQDIDSPDFVMQVKYKETAKFTPSEIKKPVIQLIEEYQKNPNKNYILYCYFGDFNSYDPSKINIDKILGKYENNYSTSIKTGFASKFSLNFGSNFDLQLVQTIHKISELGYKEEEAIIHHTRLTQHLRNLVVNNNPASISNRNCTKKELIELVKDDRIIIFNSAFREYRGDKAYLSKLKKDYFSARNVDTYTRIFIIELDENENVPDLKDLIYKFVNKFIKSNTRGLKGNAPYIYFRNIKDETLKQLKSEIFDEGVIFRDGYNFKDADFNLKSIIEQTTNNNQVSLKLITNENELVSILNYEFDRKTEVFQFFHTKKLPTCHKNSEYNIFIKEINDLNNIL